MCSISGASFVPGSTINKRKVLSALLTHGEVRGRDASGYGWVTDDGQDGIYKKAVVGSKLHVGKLPLNATAFISHTRAATQGTVRENENNHPVTSISGNTRLVHNGVIYNDGEIRRMLGKNGKALAEVDSAVIPELIETFGLDSSDQLAGYAAAAWFDRETDNTIHLARFKQAPVSFATLWDGSFVFASTDSILGKALNQVGELWYGSYPGPFDDMDEGAYYQILNGEIISEAEVEWKARYSYSGPDHRAQTEGGQTARSTGVAYSSPYKPAAAVPRYEGGTVSKTPTTVNPDAPKPSDPSKSHGFGIVKGSEDKALVIYNGDENETIADLVEQAQAEDADRKVVSNVSDHAVAMQFLGLANELDDEDYEQWNFTKDPDMPSVEDFLNSGQYELFYTESHDGDYVTFTTLRGMLEKLSWESKEDSGENHLVAPDDGPVAFINQIADLGSLSADGTDNYSWVRDEGTFQSIKQFVPFWVGEGIDKLRNLVGA